MKKKAAFIALVIFCVLLVGCGKKIESLDDAKDLISNFEIDFDSDSGIFKITEYEGEKDVLCIESGYVIAKEMRTPDLSDFQVGSRNVKFLILEDGITNIGTSTFNLSEVESVYFPKSMEEVYDYTLSYFHPDDGEKIKIYYGGTEEEWNQIITKYTPQSVSDAWNSDKSTEERAGDAGGVLADKLNMALGSEYKKSDFEFHYSISMQDLVDIINNE